MVRGGELALAATIQFENSLDPQALRATKDALYRFNGSGTDFSQISDDEILVINFRDDSTKVPGKDDRAFVDAINDLIDAEGASLGVASLRGIWTQGKYGQVQDWARDVPGFSLLDADGIRQRPGLQAWLLDRRDAFERLLTKYSGESLAEIERAAATGQPAVEQPAAAQQPVEGQPLEGPPPLGQSASSGSPGLRTIRKPGTGPSVDAAINSIPAIVDSVQFAARAANPAQIARIAIALAVPEGPAAAMYPFL